MNLKKLHLDWEFAQLLNEFRQGRKYINGCCGGIGKAVKAPKKQTIQSAPPSSAMRRGG